MISETREQRWCVTIVGNEREESLVVNSIDGDRKSVKVRLGTVERIVSVDDMIHLLRRVAANTDGIPAYLDPE